MTRLLTEWDSLVTDHAAAVQQFLAAAQQLPPGAWSRPLAEGKWTPAEVTSHLTESYRVLRSELAGGPGMALRLRRVQRWVLRHTILPRILSSGLFPAGARAPHAQAGHRGGDATHEDIRLGHGRSSM